MPGGDFLFTCGADISLKYRAEGRPAERLDWIRFFTFFLTNGSSCARSVITNRFKKSCVDCWEIWARRSRRPLWAPGVSRLMRSKLISALLWEGTHRRSPIHKSHGGKVSRNGGEGCAKHHLCDGFTPLMLLFLIPAVAFALLLHPPCSQSL